MQLCRLFSVNHKIQNKPNNEKNILVYTGFNDDDSCIWPE